MRNLAILLLVGMVTMFVSCSGTGNKSRIPVSTITVLNGETPSISGQNVKISVKVKTKGGDLESVHLYLDDSLIYKGNQQQFTYEIKTTKLLLGSHVLKIATKNTNNAVGINFATFDLLSDIAPELLIYKVVKTYSHNTENFTQGLQIVNGILYEGTGEYGKSKLFRMSFPSLKVLTSVKMDDQYFGEGITVLKGKIYQITYKEQQGFIYNASTLGRIGSFNYSNKEGWGLTNDGHYLIMSDGTETLTYLNPSNLKPVKHVCVCDNQQKITQLNELEYINGFVYANIWTTNTIVKIDPKTGKVVGRLMLDDLLASVNNTGKPIDVMNGIAYNPEEKTLLITGKYWPKMFELKLAKL